MFNWKKVPVVTSFLCLQASFFRSKGKCSHLLYYLKNVNLYNIFINIDMSYRCCSPHIDGESFIFMMLLCLDYILFACHISKYFLL